jgi:PAS domain S-box-containing protein
MDDMIQQGPPAGEPSRPAPRVLLAVGQRELAQRIAVDLRGELSCQVDFYTDAVEALAEVAAADPPYDVAFLDGLHAATSAAESPGWSSLIERLQELPLRPEILVIAGQDADAAAALLRSGAFQILKEPLLPGELAAATLRAADHRLSRGWSERVRQLEALHHTSLTMAATLERVSLLQTILEAAVRLLHAESGGIYEYHPERQMLTVVADFRRPHHLSTTLRTGEGIAGKLVENGAPFMIVADYNAWEGRAEIYHGDRTFGAVIEVPLKQGERIIGVLYVDDVAGRKFTLEEARLLGLFADQAAIALINSALLARNEARRERLKGLAKATQEIMADLRERSLDERLTLLARHVAEVTNAELAGVFLVKRPGFLSLEASFGHRPGTFDKGREVKITSGPKTGLTGHIAHEGTLFNLHGEALVRHFAVRGVEVTANPSRHCYSLLAIPLKKKSGDQETLVGLLRAENKKGADDVSHSSLAFTDEDEEIIKIFAEAVTVALELSDQKDWLNRLVASSPDGIIAVDRQGRITLFNKEAERILGYLESEVMHTDVCLLYVDHREPRKIGRLLHESRTGRVSNYETEVRSKHGEAIPIRHASTWIYDSQERIGSVGYFEDLRSIRLVEKRLESLLRANAIIAQARSLSEGMRGLTEMMASLLPHSFCRILLVEEGRGRMNVEACHVANGFSFDLQRLKAPMAIADWPGLERRLQAGAPYRLRWPKPEDRPVLERLSQWLGLAATLQAVLVSPLRSADKVVGLIEFGEMERETRREFTREEVEFASQIAAHTTALIDRIRLSATVARRTELLTALDEASRTMRAEKEPSKLLQELVRLAVQLLSCTAGGLFLNRPHLGEVELKASYEIPDQPEWKGLGRNQTHSDGLVGEVARTGQTRFRLQYDTWAERDALFRQLHFETAAAVPLKSAGDVDAVLFVADASGRQQFGQEDLKILERFAAQAAIALEISALMSPEVRSLGHLKILHKISDYIQREHDLDNILNVILTGITASYGVGFNRAVLLLFDERRQALLGRAAIGHLEQEEAQRAWEEGRQQGLEDFKAYLERLEAQELPMTPLGRVIRQVSLPLQLHDPDPLSRAVIESRWLLLPAAELASLPQVFRDVTDPTTEVIVVPLEARGQVRGLLIADNKFTLAPITDETVETLLTFVNTASIALDNRQLLRETAQRNADLEGLLLSAEEIARSAQVSEVLHAIAHSAIAICSGSFAVLWPYDTERMEFVATEAVVSGVEPEEHAELDEIRELGQSLGRAVARQGWLADADVLNQEPRFVAADLRQRLARARVASFQAIALRVREELVGVLFVAYRHARSFGERDQQLFEAFANNAALSLKNIRLLDRVRQAKKGAEFVAHTMTSDQLTLPSIAGLAREALKCDAVVLYSYDTREGRWLYPAESGVIDPEAAWPPGKEDRVAQSIVSEVLRRGYLEVATDLETSDLLRNSHFARQQGIVSCVAAPLTAAGQKVGVMFVNYRLRRYFTPESLGDIALFADQAAVAIRMAQLLDRLQREQLQALQDFEHQIKSPVVQAHARIQRLLAYPQGCDLTKELVTIAGLCAKAKGVSTNIRLFAELYRGETIQAQLKPVPTEKIVELLKESARDNSSLIEPLQGVTYRVDYPSFDEWGVEALQLDEKLIEHAINNLLDNAFKYSYPVEVVKIRGGRTPDGAFHICISSRGVPLLPEEVPKAIERGWQSQYARSTNAGGKGIGLWIVDNIMKAHGGAIEVKATTEQGETEIRLVFPPTAGQDAPRRP